MSCVCTWWLTGQPGPKHRSGAAPRGWECWEPFCHRHQRSAAARREIRKVLKCEHMQTHVWINNVMTVKVRIVRGTYSAARHPRGELRDSTNRDTLWAGMIQHSHGIFTENNIMKAGVCGAINKIRKTLISLCWLLQNTWTWAGGPRSDEAVGWMFSRGGSWCVGLRGDWGILVPELVIGCSIEKASIVLPSTKTHVKTFKSIKYQA